MNPSTDTLVGVFKEGADKGWLEIKPVITNFKKKRKEKKNIEDSGKRN